MTRPPVALSLRSTRPEEIKMEEGNMSASATNVSPPAYQPHVPSATASNSHHDNSIPPRPRPLIFSVSTLLEIPGRLARPPSVKSVGKQWSIVPEMAVSLDEIIAMRHLSPLSLKDFEQYLLFEEYGAENLYFLLWLNDYTAQSHGGGPSLRLCHSVARSKATFFSSDSQYELNLAAVRISEFYALADNAAPGSSATSPHPDAFAAIRRDVEVMLRTSARRFVQSRGRNAGAQRALCVVFGGLLTMAIALAPLMISHFSERNRYIRFGMIPPLWLGLTVFLCSANGICLILYLMGGSRQLHPFELIRPTISAPVPHEPQSPYQASFTTMDTAHEAKVSPMPSNAGSFVQYPSATHNPQGVRARDAVNLNSRREVYVLPRIRPATPLMESEFDFETAGFIPSQDGDDTATVSDHSSTYVESTMAPSSAGARSSATKFTFDFDSLPVKTLNAASGPPMLESARGKGLKGLFTKLFGPVTRVRSPVISRAQWEVVIRSMAVAAMVALIVSGVLVAVPF